jgi:hypothetical protein
MDIVDLHDIVCVCVCLYIYIEKAFLLYLQSVADPESFCVY